MAEGSTREKQLPEHVTLPLLTLITEQSMDGDYQHVAERRQAEGKPAAGRGPTRTAALVVALFGLLIVVAAVQTSRDAASTEEGRQELIRQINLARDGLNASQSEISDLRAENTDLTENLQSLRQQDQQVSSALSRTRAFTGFGAVAGPGVRLTVDDSADGSDDGRVRDEDLALLVDGLWLAGAEAISVNGHRLTSLSGIRNVNRAIHIKAQPLRPPYEVLAIGNPNDLQALFQESRPGLQWSALVSNYGIQFSMENSSSDLSLPGTPAPLLRSAQVLAGEPPNLKEATP